MTQRGFVVGLVMIAVALLTGLFVLLSELRDQNREIIEALHGHGDRRVQRHHGRESRCGIYD